jgi:hypothetical protein
MIHYHFGKNKKRWLTGFENKPEIKNNKNDLFDREKIDVTGNQYLFLLILFPITCSGPFHTLMALIPHPPTFASGRISTACSLRPQAKVSVLHPSTVERDSSRRKTPITHLTCKLELQPSCTSD